MSLCAGLGVQCVCVYRFKVIVRCSTICLARGVRACVKCLRVVRVVYCVMLYGLFLLFLFVWVLCEYVCVMCVCYCVRSYGVFLCDVCCVAVYVRVWG